MGLVSLAVLLVFRCGGEAIAAWPLLGAEPPDLITVDRLARLGLLARELGLSLEVRDAGPDLVALIELAGLAGCLLGGRWAGRPKAAKRFVSRKLWCPTIRSPDTSITW